MYNKIKSDYFYVRQILPLLIAIKHYSLQNLPLLNQHLICLICSTLFRLHVSSSIKFVWIKQQRKSIQLFFRQRVLRSLIKCLSSLASSLPLSPTNIPNYSVVVFSFSSGNRPA